MQLAIFEDQTYENFYPLTLIRPIYELKCGQTMLHEKIVRTIKADKVAYFARDYLTEVIKQRNPGASVNDVQSLKGDDLLLVNGRWLFVDNTNIELDGDEEVGISEPDGTVLYIRVKKNTIDSCIASSFEEFFKKVTAKVKKKVQLNTDVISYPWDLIVQNCRAIVDDFKKRGDSGINGKVHKTAVIEGKESQIYIAPTATVQAYVTIDATEGPVTIDEQAIVCPNSWITGPVYIGPKTMIVGAKVREGMAIGPECRVGGEVEESIMHGFVNKWHDGFLGHSYAGEGINFGADTINSDVKNDFGNIQVYVKGDFVDTGQWKVGAFVGDYTKTGIGTLFNTGSSIGLLSIILGGDGVLPKFIPSFSWYINRKVTKGFGFGKLLEAANGQLSKRNRTLTEAELNVLKKAYEIAKPERDAIVKRDRQA